VRISLKDTRSKPGKPGQTRSNPVKNQVWSACRPGLNRLLTGFQNTREYAKQLPKLTLIYFVPLCSGVLCSEAPDRRDQGAIANPANNLFWAD
jgi:hypothetical protein